MSMTRAERRREQKLAKKATDQAGYAHTSKEEQALDRAVEYHQAGQLALAEGIYRAILTENPNHPMALHYLGLLAHQMGNSEISVQLIKQAITIEPDYVEAYSNLANALLHMGQAEDAIAYCRKAIAIDPKVVSAHNTLGKSFALQGRFEDAIDSCQTALMLNPYLTDAFETLGKSLRGLGRLDEAVETYQKAISVDPKSALFHNNLGSALHMRSQLEPAIDSYKKAITLQPEYALAYQNLGNALRDAGRTDEAIASLQKALEHDPNLISTRHNLDALLGNKTGSAPNEYVEELFDQFAGQFEIYLQDKLEYKMPALLKKVLVDMGLAKNKYKKVADLGCGTGLAGVEFRDVAENLIGIDLSKNMVVKAKDKEVYDQLYVDDLINGLDKVGKNTDLFIATDVFVYIGDLTETFKAVKKYAAPGAVFLFSTEHIDDGDFVLQSTSRYAHSKAYIQGLADQFGFEVAHHETSNLRKEKDGWITGASYVLKST